MRPSHALLPAAAAWLLLLVGYAVGTIPCDRPVDARDAASARGLYVMLAGLPFAWAAVVASVTPLRSRGAVMLALTGIPVAAAAAFFPFAVAIPVVILLVGSWAALRAGGARTTGRWSLAASWFVAAPVVAFRALSHCGLTLF